MRHKLTPLGFVEFSNPETATAAQRAMDGRDLEGHQLQIKASHKGADAAEERRREDATKKTASTKILIKNLPFEASKKDVRALFSRKFIQVILLVASLTTPSLRSIEKRPRPQKIRFIFQASNFESSPDQRFI
jgi:RNA recognition motif-containing protein